MQNDPRVEALNSLLEKSSQKIANFAIDIVENGYILSLILVEEQDGVTLSRRPTLCFENPIKLELILNAVISKVNTQKLL